jgi:hypothetical protein
MAILIACGVRGYAQATVANNNILPTDYLGVQAGNASDLLFKTNGVERARMKTDGSFLYSSQGGSTPIAFATFGIGPRMFYVPGTRSGAFRAGYVDNTSWDDGNIGNTSTAFGYDTRAAGYTAFAVNSNTTASGDRSFAAGYATAATGVRAFACGDATTASGEASISLNYNTTAESYAEAVFGRYNVTSVGYSPSGWVNTDPLFVIGNGTSVLAPANALTILKNGMTGYGPITSPTYRIEIPNNADVTGWGLANAWKTYSSIRYKEHVKTIPGALAKVQQLRGVEFDWKPGNGGRHDIGFIAEELGRVLPEVVDYEENGVDARSVNYPAVIPVAIEAIKEQQAIIGSQEIAIAGLKEKMTELAERLARLESPPDVRLGVTPDEKHQASVALAQNVPNPADEATIISYFLPRFAHDAHLVVAEAGSGREVRSIPLEGRGAGSVTIPTSELPAGSYLYSIVVDGSTTQSMKMSVMR